jgi:hypothetical protein
MSRFLVLLLALSAAAQEVVVEGVTGARCQLPAATAGGCWNNYDITGAPRHPWTQPSPHETVTNKEDPDDRMRSTRSLARERTPTH